MHREEGGDGGGEGGCFDFSNHSISCPSVSVGPAHYNSISVTQSQNITLVRVQKRDEGREKSREC